MYPIQSVHISLRLHKNFCLENHSFIWDYKNPQFTVQLQVSNHTVDADKSLKEIKP